MVINTINVGKWHFTGLIPLLCSAIYVMDKQTMCYFVPLYVLFCYHSDAQHYGIHFHLPF